MGQNLEPKGTLQEFRRKGIPERRPLVGVNSTGAEIGLEYNSGCILISATKERQKQVIRALVSHLCTSK